MRRIMLAIAATAVSAISFAATSTPEGFTDDLDAAISAAKTSGKTVFAVFSGSDWCYWCKVLEKDYLSKKEFVKEASKNFELVYIDSPRDKSKLSAKAAKQNPVLVEKYNIRGYPTVKFIAADGTASKASRPGQNATPKAYAEALAREIKYAPLIEKHIKPLNDAFEKCMQEIHSNGSALNEDPFEKATEAEQRAAFAKMTEYAKQAIVKLKAFRDKAAKTDVPAEIDSNKKEFLKNIDTIIGSMTRFSSMSFNQLKKMREGATKRSGKNKKGK